MHSVSRRSFIGVVAGGAAASAVPSTLASGASTATGNSGPRPVIISSSNGRDALGAGMSMLKNGGDPLDAVLATVNIVENDPEDDSVGYGGLPNEAGVVQLDACVMHGPTARAGAVGGIERIKNPSSVAKLVMERTEHIMLIGRGALAFAKAHGFPEDNLLTERSRVAWLAWKESMSDRDAWGTGIMSPEWKERTARLLPRDLAPEQRERWLAHIHDVLGHRPTGTINCLAVTAGGDLAGTTTTSGLAWKIPGRVGDSPLIGSGLFVDNEVGAAGSTGRGEENIRVCGAHTIVEMMRLGRTPVEACSEAIDRIVHNYKGDRSRLRHFSIKFYALNRDGAFGSATLWARRRNGDRNTYAVDDGSGVRIVDCTPYFEGSGWDDTGA